MKDSFGFENILNLISCNMYWKDKDGIYLGCNDFMAKICGLTNRNDVIGKTDYDLPWYESAGQLREFDCQVMQTGAPITKEEVSKLYDGRIVTFLSTKIPLRNEKEETIGIFGISMDISDQKSKASALEQAQRNMQRQIQLTKIYLENILTNLPEPIYWMDNDGIMLGCNEKEAKLFGLTSKEFVGKTIYDFAKLLGWKKEMADALRRNEIEIMQTGKGKIVEEIAEINNVMRTYISHKAPLRDEKGEIIGIIGTSVDITDRKKTEQELKQAQENTELANKAVRIFAESMAHELRTPLASLNGYFYGIKKYLSILVEGYRLAKENNLPVTNIRAEHYRSMLMINNNIEAEINHANAVIDMILFRSDPNKLKSSNLKICSIEACIKRALERFPFKSSTERLLINWQEDKDFLFLGEELFTIHVLFNLFKNALYYISKERRGEIFIWIELGKEYNTLFFKDTSKGIAAHILPNIFDLYFSDTPHGTGVGLAFCKQVMQIFSGNIDCESEEGKYTTFILKFPVLNNRKNSKMK